MGYYRNPISEIGGEILLKLDAGKTIGQRFCKEYTVVVLEWISI